MLYYPIGQEKYGGKIGCLIGDEKMANTTVKAGTKNVINSGVVLHGGSIASSMSNLALMDVSLGNHNTLTVASPHNGMGYSQVGAATAITAITQSGSTGFVNIQKATHGLTVGDVLMVYGASVSGYNTTHTVTVVTDANNVKTNVTYTADTSVTHGSYKKGAGTYNVMAEGKYIARFISGGTLAGIANNALVFTSAQKIRRHIDGSNSTYRYDITSWDYVTGRATKGANAGAAYSFVDPVGGGTANDSAIIPTMAIPGEFTYLVTGQVPTNVDYAAKYSY